MSKNYSFDQDILASMAGGRSALDIRFLNIHNLEQAESFINSYGFRADHPDEMEKLWYFYRRAIVLLTEKLGFALEAIPEILRDRRNLQDLRLLLVWASSQNPDEQTLQHWSCAILRCMHVFVHAENDLFSSFSEEIQKQILTPFVESVAYSGAEHAPVLVAKKSSLAPVELVEFKHKPFKTSSSTVIKLLAKPDALAMKVFDKLGVRFVTKSIFDSFQVLRFLWRENIVSFPHIMPDQSSNNLYPSALFVKVCQELEEKGLDPADSDLEEMFEARLKLEGAQYKPLRKENSFSSEEYRFVKFISRKLIHIPGTEGRPPFSFFFPFEVQILDQAAHSIMQAGPSEHEAYKERQRQGARERLFPGNKI